MNTRSGISVGGPADAALGEEVGLAGLRSVESNVTERHHFVPIGDPLLGRGLLCDRSRPVGKRTTAGHAHRSLPFGLTRDDFRQEARRRASTRVGYGPCSAYCSAVRIGGQHGGSTSDRQHRQSMYLHDAGRLGGDRGYGVPASLQVDAFHQLWRRAAGWGRIQRGHRRRQDR